MPYVDFIIVPIHTNKLKGKMINIIIRPCLRPVASYGFMPEFVHSSQRSLSILLKWDSWVGHSTNMVFPVTFFDFLWIQWLVAAFNSFIMYSQPSSCLQHSLMNLISDALILLLFCLHTVQASLPQVNTDCGKVL